MCYVFVNRLRSNLPLYTPSPGLPYTTQHLLVKLLYGCILGHDTIFKMFPHNILHCSLFHLTESSATDSCDQSPLDLTIALPPTCKVTLDGVKVRSVNVGRCNNVPCVMRTSSDSGSLCCIPSGTRQLQVECDGFSYEVSQVVSCGCAKCINNKNVTVSGRASSGGAGDTNVYVLYDDVTYNVTNSQFLFEATPQAGHVVFQVKSSAFMPQLVTLDVSEGVSQIYIEVSLVVRPNPDVIDVATGAELNVTTPGMSSAVSVTIPYDSFQDKNGDPVSGNVNVFLSFSDPRQSDGLDSAPGQFTFQDSEGETRLLKTFGVVTLMAEDMSGNEVYLSGKATLKFDAEALGIEVGESVFLWSIDSASGQWQKSGELTYSGSLRRRRRQTIISNTLNGETEIPRRRPFINIDIYIPTPVCYVFVYVYYGGDFSVPMSGERVNAYTIENGRFIGSTSAISDQNGRACLLVACGLKHIVKLFSRGGIIVHSTHSLPDVFPFNNTVNGFEFTATPPANEVDSVNGPVFRSESRTDSCRAYNSSAFFMLSVLPTRPYLYGSLNAGNRWFPDPPAKWQACAFLVILNVSTTNNTYKRPCLSN